MISEEEDDMLVKILTNKYGVEPSSCIVPNCSLQSILPLQSLPQLPVVADYLHILLSHEIMSPSFIEFIMLDKVVKVEISPGRELNVKKNLTPEHSTSILKLLQENQQAFSWDYIDMMGLDPRLCTH